MLLGRASMLGASFIRCTVKAPVIALTDFVCRDARVVFAHRHQPWSRTNGRATDIQCSQELRTLPDRNQDRDRPLASPKLTIPRILLRTTRRHTTCRLIPQLTSQVIYLDSRGPTCQNMTSNALLTRFSPLRALRK